MSKDRIIVMNGSKLTERMQADNSWKTQNVEPAGNIRAGIYNIHNAIDGADKSSTGQIIHSDKDYVYQMVSQNRFVKHQSSKFDKIPDNGAHVSIEFNGGKASTTVVDASITRGRRR